MRLPLVSSPPSSSSRTSTCGARWPARSGGPSAALAAWWARLTRAGRSLEGPALAWPRDRRATRRGRGGTPRCRCAWPSAWRGATRRPRPRETGVLRRTRAAFMALALAAAGAATRYAAQSPADPGAGGRIALARGRSLRDDERLGPRGRLDKDYLLDRGMARSGEAIGRAAADRRPRAWREARAVAWAEASLEQAKSIYGRKASTSTRPSAPPPTR